jgi:hypothetical protein
MNDSLPFSSHARHMAGLINFSIFGELQYYPAAPPL